MLTALRQLTVGLEVEVTGGANDAVNLLHDENLVGDSYLHRYHCDCSSCEHSISRPNIFTGQEDCTVDGEFITRPVFMGDTGSWLALERAGAVFAYAGAYADPDESTGCHVHVGAEGLDDLGTIELDGMDRHPRERLAQFFVPLQDDLRQYARGSVGKVRGYNRPIDSDPRYRNREGWLHLRTGSDTVEFRLWNGTTTAWRWRMYAGISAAMVLAVMEGRPPADHGARLTDALDGILDDETLALMARQASTPL
jgi:hypothetical protein